VKKIIKKKGINIILTKVIVVNCPPGMKLRVRIIPATHSCMVKNPAIITDYGDKIRLLPLIEKKYRKVYLPDQTIARTFQE